jgi:MFS family permease
VEKEKTVSMPEARMNVVDDATRGWSIRLFLLLAAAFTIAVGYGVILPVLPFFLERVAADGRFSVSWHTGMLTGVYMFSLFVFAPLWGHVSDRLGRRPVILLGLAGFGASMVLFGLAGNLTIAYLARALGGLFSAAVLPVTLAYVGDMNPPEQRARGFAWMSAANALGFLAGPALGGWLSELRPPAAVADVLPAGATALPFFAAAVLGGLVWLGIYFRFSEALPAPRTDDARAPAPNAEPLNGLLALTLLVMFSLGSFEIGVALLGQQILNLAPSDIGIMFMECSLVMIAVQVLVLSPLLKRFGRRLLAPASLAMAVGVGLIPDTANYPVLLMLVGLIAASSGLLIPALAYLISLAAGLRQGAALGRQTAAASLGQALGSAAAGALFGLMVPAPFWLTAGLLVISAGIGLGVARRAP